MRHRTKTHLLTKEQIDELLLKAEVGRLGTISEDGFPYILPIYFPAVLPGRLRSKFYVNYYCELLS